MARPQDPIDEYFTRTIVGDSLHLLLGPSHPVRRAPTRRPWIEAAGQQLHLHGVAARSLIQGERVRSSARVPVSSAKLHRLRRDLAVAALVVWSAALWLLFRVLHD